MIQQTIEQIKKSSLSPLKETRVVDAIEVGQFVRQGDVYVIRIESVPPDLNRTSARQLAPGSTQGSRHTVSDAVTVFERNMDRINSEFGLAFAGPIIESADRFTVMHPEHADISLPGGCYEIRYQSDFASQQRAKD